MTAEHGPGRWARHPIPGMRLPVQEQRPEPTTLEYVSRVGGVWKITDGDTYWLVLRLPFRHAATECIRLVGYDCPERTKGSAWEKTRAKDATTLASVFITETLTSPGCRLWVRTEPDPDDFGRWLGDLWREYPDGSRRHLGAELRSAGLASIWPTRWRDEFDTTTTGANG